MSGAERRPLLGDAVRPQTPVDELTESTGLLSGSDTTPRYDGHQDQTDEAPSIRSRASECGKSSRRWPSIIAMVALALLSIAIIVLAFVVPAAVQEYAKEAFVLEPTNLSVESITATGVRARVQANLRLDGQRVKNGQVRRIGRLVTWVVRELGIEETNVKVFLPDYGGSLIGQAALPSVTVSVLDGKITAVDLVADLIPGEAEAVRLVVNDWLDGRLDNLSIQVKADVPLKSGLIPLGTHGIVESLAIEAGQLPDLPKYNVTNLTFRELPVPGEQHKVISANVSITAHNTWPISIDIPKLGFEILLPGCDLVDPYIQVADAFTSVVEVHPRSDIKVDVQGFVRRIPDTLVNVCPNSRKSPLDVFVNHYIAGDPALVFVRGKPMPDSDLPVWLSEIMTKMLVPVAFPNEQNGSGNDIIRNFTLSDVQLSMPDPAALPGSPSSNPTVSGTVRVLAAVPLGIDFQLNVTGVRATADVMYKSKKLGELYVQPWHDANSTKQEASPDDEAALEIQSRVDDAPLNVTDADVLADVIERLLFSGKDVLLDISALVDVKVVTFLGEVVLKDVPAQGKIPIKPLPKGGLEDLMPRVGNMDILSTTSSSVTIQAQVNLTNPTSYSAYIPFISVHLKSNDSVLGDIEARNLEITTGDNSNLLMSAVWHPSQAGPAAARAGRELLSKYLSGFNTSITLGVHRDSIPSQPLIGAALSKINLTVPTPRLHVPGEDGEGPVRFIREATFHIFSSSASFVLASPLQHDTLYIDYINATAYYNHTEPIGRIEYDQPIAIPPFVSLTPKLPVDWSLGSVGYDKVRKALGGQLKLDAQANVSLRLGAWTETVWFVGEGIGAKVRL